MRWPGFLRYFVATGDELNITSGLCPEGAYISIPPLKTNNSIKIEADLGGIRETRLVSGV